MKNKTDKQINFSKKTRCPWCGNILYSRMPLFTRRFDDTTKKCVKCDGYSVPEDRLTDLLYDLTLLMAVFIFGNLYTKVSYLEIYGIIFLIMAYFWRNFFCEHVPYKRIKGYYEKGRVMPSDWSLKEQVLFYAHIKWNRSKRHIFKFWNSKLLIIIAVDKNNQPISQPLCVRIRKCKTGYELTKIVRAFEFNNKTCRRFFVYWGDELVGEGTVISKFYL